MARPTRCRWLRGMSNHGLATHKRPWPKAVLPNAHRRATIQCESVSHGRSFIGNLTRQPSREPPTGLWSANLRQSGNRPILGTNREQTDGNLNRKTAEIHPDPDGARNWVGISCRDRVPCRSICVMGGICGSVPAVLSQGKDDVIRRLCRGRRWETLGRRAQGACRVPFLHAPCSVATRTRPQGVKPSAGERTREVLRNPKRRLNR
jgi:hypothetical protein